MDQTVHRVPAGTVHVRSGSQPPSALCWVWSWRTARLHLPCTVHLWCRGLLVIYCLGSSVVAKVLGRQGRGIKLKVGHRHQIENSSQTQYHIYYITWYPLEIDKMAVFINGSCSLCTHFKAFGLCKVWLKWSKFDLWPPSITLTLYLTLLSDLSLSK